MPRIGIFGWGLVAPKSPNLESFARNLDASESWLSAFNGFGPDNFLVGQPELDFEAYHDWVDARFPPNRFPQLVDKMDPTVQLAIASFIQSLDQNAGLEAELQALGADAHVYFGTGLGCLPTIHHESLELDRAQRRWNAFWAASERNAARRAHDESPDPSAPANPETVEPADRPDAQGLWDAFWTERSDGLAEYLEELKAIEGLKVEGDIDSGKMAVMKEKRRQLARLEQKWQHPLPPWRAVSANLLWNIANIPAAQVSMLGQIRGLTFAPVAACSTFGVALKLALDAIRSGDAKAVVVGAADPPPHPLTVGGFYNARVISADAAVSKPLSELRGTHVAGGSVCWIVGDYDYFTAKGFRALGMEPLAVGTSSDADHIITPSQEGPTTAVHRALAAAGLDAESISGWDLHATATPGDFTEVATLKAALPGPMVVTARKGTHGHGMAASGGWELTAQYLGYERGRLFPTPLGQDELNPEIHRLHDCFVFDTACVAPEGPAGKLSMGIGGINACVISRPWER